MNSTEQGTLTGAAGGAIIGAGLGASGGYLYDLSRKNEQRAYVQGCAQQYHTDNY